MAKIVEISTKNFTSLLVNKNNECNPINKPSKLHWREDSYILYFSRMNNIFIRHFDASEWLYKNFYKENGHVTKSRDKLQKASV